MHVYMHIYEDVHTHIHMSAHMHTHTHNKPFRKRRLSVYREVKKKTRFIEQNKKLEGLGSLGNIQDQQLLRGLTQSGDRKQQRAGEWTLEIHDNRSYGVHQDPKSRLASWSGCIREPRLQP